MRQNLEAPRHVELFGGCRVAGLPDWCRQLNVAESAALREMRRRVRLGG